MRKLRTILASITLSLCVGSSLLFAQTEKPNQAEKSDQIENQPTAVQPDKTATATAGDSKTQVETEIKSTESSPADIKDAKAVAPQKTVDSGKAADPKKEVQQTPTPTVVRKNPGKFTLTFDDLKFDQEKDEAFDRKLLTSKINGYHGGKVKIRGYIRPNFKQSGITKFIFVRDNKECCFGPQADIFDNIMVRLDKGTSTNFTVRPITIEGDFVIKEYYGEGGEVFSVYRMYNAKVK